MARKKIILDEFQQEQFDAWMEDGNVSKKSDGTYSTQDSGYRNRLKDLDALKEYFYKEFIEGQYDNYERGGKVNKVLFAVRVGKPDWAEELITENESRIEEAKEWAKNNGFDRFRIAEIDMSEKPKFKKGGSTKTKINKKYKYFAQNKEDKKIYNGWELVDDVESLKHYAKLDLKDNGLKPSDFNIISAQALVRQGIDPFDSDNWFKIDNTTKTEKEPVKEENQFDDAGTSMVMYHEKKGNFIVPKGQIYLWLYDVENSAEKLQSEVFDWVFYPHATINLAMSSDFIPPLQRIWTKKFQKEHKGSEHLLGVIKAYLIVKENGEKELFIDMMSVNPTKKKKGIMSYMIKELRNIFKLSKEQVTFSELTKEGEKFVGKKTYDNGGGVDVVKKDRYGNDVKIGDAIHIRVLTGRYGQTKDYEGIVTNFDKFGNVELDGQRSVNYTADYKHNDYEHGHHIWVEKINAKDIKENLRVPKKFIPTFSSQNKVYGEDVKFTGTEVEFKEFLKNKYPNSVWGTWFSLYNIGWKYNGKYISPDKQEYDGFDFYQSVEQGQGYLKKLMIPKKYADGGLVLNPIPKVYELELDYKIGQKFEKDILGGTATCYITSIDFDVEEINGVPVVNSDSYRIEYKCQGNTEASHFSFLKKLTKDKNKIKIQVPYSIGGGIFFENSKYDDEIKLLNGIVNSFKVLYYGTRNNWYDYYVDLKGKNYIIDSKDAYSSLDNYINRVSKDIKNFKEPKGGELKIKLDYKVGQKIKIPVLGGFKDSEITGIDIIIDAEDGNLLKIRDDSRIKYKSVYEENTEDSVTYQYFQEKKYANKVENEISIDVKALYLEDFLTLNRYMDGSKLSVKKLMFYLLSIDENGYKVAYSGNDFYFQIFTSINDFKEKISLIPKKYADGGAVYPDLSLEKPAVVNDNATIKVPEFEIKKIKQDLHIKSDKITSSSDAVNIFREIWNPDTINAFEQAYVLYLNKNNKVIGYYAHSSGGVDGTVMDVQMISGMALKSLAKGVIIAHNHPSDNTQPSDADTRITKQLKEGLKLFNILLVDSLILTENNYRSFADEGWI
jgi:DNA repair protein RadC